MKILFSSHVFYPNIGGLETVSLLLAREFTHAGHQVKLVTQTCKKEPEPDFPFDVLRRPLPSRLLRLTTWADVVFHNNISLRTAWPLLLIKRPWVIAHHVWIPRNGGLWSWKGWLKHWAIRKATGIAISKAIASDFSTSCRVIPNPYDDKVFRILPDILRDKDLVFVGRLITDKGVDLLLRSVAVLKVRGLMPSLTIVGGGPEEIRIKELALDLGINRQVVFAGVKRDEELAKILNGHRIIVVPSLCLESFGMVALEGIACGCAVVGSEGGGLKEAIGPCGYTFPNGNVRALSACLEELLTHPKLVENFRYRVDAHLSSYRSQAVVSAYLQVMEEVRRSSR